MSPGRRRRVKTFEPDSSLVPRVEPSLGCRRGAYEPRTREACASVVHTTGMGPLLRATSLKRKWVRWRKRYDITDPFEAALWIYRRAMKAGPHYVLGQKRGQLAQVCPENLCAWGVGGRGGRAYRKTLDGWSSAAHRWWRRDWRGHQSPRELGGGRLWLSYSRPTGIRVALSSLAGSVNANVYHIEVVPPLDDPRGPWSEACWEMLTSLVIDIHARNQLVVAQDTVITHSDAHPIARTARGQPWDTVLAQFSWSEFASRVLTP